MNRQIRFIQTEGHFRNIKENDGLTDIIGDTGELPVTFYIDMEGMPEFTDYSMKNRTYRYMEKEALYPFGYGLTYGDVQVAEVKCLQERFQWRFL